MNLATTIQSLRKIADLSVEEAAARAGISVSYWQKLEAGQMKNPTYTVLGKIAGALGIKAPTLLPEQSTA